MGRGRGRPRGGRGGRSSSNPSRIVPEKEPSPAAVPEPEEMEVEETETPPPRRKRGRPPAGPAAASSARGGGSSKGKNEASWITEGGKVSVIVMKRVEKAMTPQETDGDLVTCSECPGIMKFRQFKLHNIQHHLNTAATMAEKHELVMDHKYFARKLNEFKKLTKATVFDCPRERCKSSFKSTLGLAYHMNTCGRTAAELDAVLLECEFCHVKLTLPNLQWHKKSHEERREVAGEQLKQVGATRKRTSAISARKFLKTIHGADGSKSGGQDDEDGGSNAEEDSGADPPQLPKNRKSQARIDRDCSDYCSLAQNFLETIDCDGKAWDDPVRNIEDSFLSMTDNAFEDRLIKEDFESYLPHHKESVEFKYITDDGTSDYHRLTWFEGETTVSTSRASLFHAGGPVLSMSWHPSGKLLAVSTGKDWREEIDAMKNQERKSSVQIYSCSDSNLSLQLVIGVKWGYITHLQWSSFYPDIMDSYNPSENFADIDIYCRIGYLAMACEDSSIRIMSVRIEDFRLEPNYEYKPGHKVKIYSKTPEICLKVHDSVIDDELGNVTKFEFHEGHRFLAAGYANGTIAVYDLLTESNFLTETITEDNDKVTVINPFWVFPGHRLPVRGLCFDPGNPRYLVTAAQDRTLKVWDMETRMLRESKRTGICLDMCWIRGWMHQAVSVESHVAHQSAMHNYMRVFSIGCSAGRPTSAELSNFTSLDCYHGLTAQGTDDGKVNVTYYDWFWRECDFDRNRKKKNLVTLSTMQLDPDSYTKLSSSDFSVNVRRVKKGVYYSKGFQRLGLQEDEGVYSAMLEAKFGGSAIFDTLSNSDNGEDFEEDDQRETQGFTRDSKLGGQSMIEDDEVTVINNGKTAALEDAMNAVHQPKQKDRLLPIYDVNIREEEPKVVMSFVRQRASASVPNAGIEHDKLEEYVRFQPFIRVSKVSWSPNGQIIAVGYRNGLVTLLPGEFESIFLPGSGFVGS